MKWIGNNPKWAFIMVLVTCVVVLAIVGIYYETKCERLEEEATILRFKLLHPEYEEAIDEWLSFEHWEKENLR